MNKKLLVYLLVFSAGGLFTATGETPKVTVVDKAANKTSVERTEVSRIDLGGNTISILKKNGEQLTFDKDKIAKLLLAEYPAGIIEVETPEISVYPYITNDIVNISGMTDNCEYHVFDLSGQLKLSGKINPEVTEVSFAHLPSGIYLLVVGNNSYKIIKR